MDIPYTLPGLTEFADIDLLFAEIARARPDMFREGVRIASLYGGFPGSRLCGGRNNPGAPMPEEAIRRRIERCNALGLGCNVTFSNQLARADELDALPYDRLILQILSEGAGNGAIVYDDGLARRIREEFPGLALIASTTKALGEREGIERALGLYDRVVIDYNRSRDEALIASLERPGGIEVMVNEYCTPGCPARDEHYRAVSEAQREGVESGFACRHADAPQAAGFFYGLVEGDVFLKNGDVARLRAAGAGMFKIVGRGLARYDIVDSYLYYLVRPEHWYEIRDFLIHHDFF